jgi:dTMP kinase
MKQNGRPRTRARQARPADAAHTQHRCYGKPPPGLNPAELNGHLIVLEGPDGSGRTTQIALLRQWLEGSGFAVVDVGLRRSTLVASEISQAMELNVLGPVTMSLFYATDFVDQLENRIVPALRAGFVVLADRYIYSLVARAATRGLNRIWMRRLYTMAIVPDAIFYLKVSPENLLARRFRKALSLDYWESGRDLGLSTDLLESFQRYQTLLQEEFLGMQRIFGFHIIDGDRSVAKVNGDLRRGIAKLLGIRPGTMPRVTTDSGLPPLEP